MKLPKILEDMLRFENERFESNIELLLYSAGAGGIYLILAIEDPEIRDIISKYPAPFILDKIKGSKVYLSKRNPSVSSETPPVHAKHVTNIFPSLIPHPLFGKSGKDLAAGIDKEGQEDQDSTY